MRSGGGSVSMAADGHHCGVSVLDIIASWMRLMLIPQGVHERKVGRYVHRNLEST